MNFTSFQPPIRTLLGPGPSDVHPRVLAALSRPTIGHLDPEFVRMMDEVKHMLQHVFQTRNAMTLAISAPGSAGMETCVANLVEPGDKVVVCQNGVFGRRLKENVERVGGIAVTVDDAWGAPVDPERLEDCLKRHPDTKVVAFVHAETSTGVLSDARTLASIAHRHGAMVIMDCVTSLAGVPVAIDEWQIDAAYSGTQKCLSCPPGLSPVTFNDRAVEKIKGRRTRVTSWFLDMTLLMGYWGDGKRVYHHTAPVNALYGLHEALVLLMEEGLEQSWARHRRNHERLRTGLEALDMQFYVAPEWRLPQLNAVVVPAGIAEARVRQRLLDEYGLEIGAGLGDLAGKIFRIGLMGYGSNVKNIAACTSALAEILVTEGAAAKKTAT
ncbi:MAG TPA: alanine--glyoxylate aminotransferase family protein [Acidiferrobacteraceae bacterium]|nr:alanine--glyoxylate aminotransferase family protein [Acidiferrobacteraceae bacterium]